MIRPSLKVSYTSLCIILNYTQRGSSPMEWCLGQPPEHETPAMLGVR